MSTQEITWTVCPNGLTADGRRLRLSIFVTPRLRPGGPMATLADFPDFTDWPARLREVRLSIAPAGDGAPVPLSIVSPPADSARWQALLPPTTIVRGYQPEPHAQRPVCTYRVPDVVEALQDAYLSTATVAVLEPPPQITPPRLQIPGLDPDLHKDPDPGLNDLFHEFAIDRTLAELPELTRQARITAQARVAAKLVPEKMLELYPVARSRGDQVKRALAFTRGWWEPKPIPQMPVRDFHERLTLLGEHGVLLRLLGLVIDAEVDLAEAALVEAHAPGATTLRVQAQWHPLLPLIGGGGVIVNGETVEPLYAQSTFDIYPVTAVDQASGFAARRDGGAPGVVPLPPEQFRLEELDVDGAVHKAVTMVAALASAGERVGPPALRTGGLALVRVGLAQQVHETLTRAMTLNGSSVLFAEDLTRGYRMDVRDLDAGGGWRSLHARTVTYEIDGTPPITDPADEGMFCLTLLSSSDDPGSEVYLHENLVVWNGWSLSAPRPEAPLPNPPSPARPVETDPLRLTVRAAVFPASLPRLRFGHRYQVRLRTVDLAGNGPGIEEAADAASTERQYLRYEPVGVPVIAPAAAQITDGEPEFGLSETTHRIVLRNYLDDRAVVTARRELLAPRGSAHLAELHGLLDDAIGQNRSRTHRDSALSVVTRDTGELTYPVGATPPYLPDPLARGLSLRGLPGLMDAPSNVDFDFGGSWHQPHTVTLACTGPDGQGPRYDPAAHTLTVPLNPGGVSEVRVCSLLSDATLMAMLRWARDAMPPADRASLEAAVATNRHCMFTPWQTLTLVHAVVRPLMTPEFAAALTIGREFTSVDVNLGLAVSVHAPTTGAVSLIADWRAQVDDLTQPRWEWRARHGTVFTHTLPEGWHLNAREDPERGCRILVLSCGPGNPLPGHQIGETRHRTITYRIVATTKFTEYFDPDAADRAGGFTLDGRPVECEILNTAPPPAPAVLGTVPALLWHEERVGRALERTRHGGVRVYLQRPWFATGDGELLGVILAAPELDGLDDAEDDPRAHLVSRIGQDPVRQAGWVNLLRPSNFRNAVATMDIELTEFRRLGDGGATTVTVVGFAPEYDERSGRWFCDIDIDTGTAYEPFVRLVVARFQPASVRDVHMPNDPALSPDACVLSPLVALDPVMTLPDRRLTVRADPDQPVDLYLAGPTYSRVRGRGHADDAPSARARVLARWARRSAGTTGPWEFTDQARHELERDEANGLWRLKDLPTQATSPAYDYRLMVAEIERAPADLGGYTERVVYADSVDVPLT